MGPSKKASILSLLKELHPDIFKELNDEYDSRKRSCLPNLKRSCSQITNLNSVGDSENLLPISKKSIAAAPIYENHSDIISDDKVVTSFFE